MPNVSQIADLLEELRAKKPRVATISNAADSSHAANALLALGAVPVMVLGNEEAAQVVAKTSSVALNTNALHADVLNTMLKAAKAANASGVPVVLHAEGLSVSDFRNEGTTRILSETKVTVLRGSHLEISFLVTGKEVGSTSLPEAMKEWAKAHRVILVATGATDYVTDGDDVFALRNGHPWMSLVSGAGSELTGLIGAFCGTIPLPYGQKDIAAACVAAITCANIAGEAAALLASGPGSFQVNWFDALYQLKTEMVRDRARIEPLSV